jgi:hypothetical protein
LDAVFNLFCENEEEKAAMWKEYGCKKLQIDANQHSCKELMADNMINALHDTQLFGPNSPVRREVLNILTKDINRQFASNLLKFDEKTIDRVKSLTDFQYINVKYALSTTRNRFGHLDITTRISARILH